MCIQNYIPTIYQPAGRRRIRDFSCVYDNIHCTLVVYSFDDGTVDADRLSINMQSVTRNKHNHWSRRVRQIWTLCVF